MAISPAVQKRLEWIEDSSDAAQLAQLKENLAPSSDRKPGFKGSAILGKLAEEERQALLDAIEAKRGALPSSAPKSRTAAGAVKAPRAAAKGREGSEFLDGLGSRLERDFDLSGNKLSSNKVKAGGDMRRKERFVDLYLAYKDEAGVSVKLFWRQDAADAAAYLEVHKTQVGGPNAGDLMAPRVFRLDQKDEAAEFYESELAKLAPWKGGAS